MSHIRSHIAPRAWPVSTVAGGVNTHGGWDTLNSPMPWNITASACRPIGGIAKQN